MPRGQATKGWREKAKALDRETLAKEHPGCFLMLNEKKYPICTQHGTVECAGIKSARRRAYINAFGTHRVLTRAQRQKHEQVFHLASALDVKLCGGPKTYGGK